MNKYLKYNIAFLLGAGLIVGPGCKKVLEPNPRALTVDVVYSDFNGSLAGINGIYAGLSDGRNGSGLYRGGIDAGVWLQIDQASDDVMDDAQGQGNAANPIDYFQLTADNGTTFNIMDGFYRIIYRANVAIDRLQPVTFPTRFATNPGTQLPFKDQFIGEAKFLRAFSYFNLVRALGGVPLHIKEIKAASEVNIPRSSVQAVYAQIESDLEDAVAKLPATGFGTGAPGSGNEAGRAPKWSALALLADVYLTQKKYDLAKTTALAVINNNGGKSLNTTYADNFPARSTAPENGRESLFEIQFASGGAAASANIPTANNFSATMGTVDQPPANASNGGPGLQRYRPTDASITNPQRETILTSGIIQQYETGDVRLDVNFNNLGRFQGNAMRLTHKYYENRGVAGNANFPVYRMAEMYLIYAEATNELSLLDALGLDYVNQLRRRAAGASLTIPRLVGPVADFAAGLTQIQYRELIRQERRRELAMENKRWFDLVRYGFDYANDALVVKQGRTGFNQNKLLFPIPRTEFVNNPNLGDNNPGY